MSNFIDKIQISGTSYDVKDASAVTVINITQADYDELPESAKTENILYNITDATPVDISQYWTSGQTNSAINEAVSGKLDTSTFQTYSGSVESALSGKADTATTYTKTEVDNAITAATSTKQDILSAGTGIDITNNVISVTGGGGGGSSYTAGYGIDIDTANTISVTGQVASSAITTAVTTASTDSEIPTAKAVNDAIAAGGGGGGGKAVSGGTNISITTGETADTINCTLPISADTNKNVILQTGLGGKDSVISGSSYKYDNFMGGYGNTLSLNGSSYGNGYNFVFGSYLDIVKNASQNARCNILFGENSGITGATEHTFMQGYNNAGYQSNQFICGYYNTSYNQYEAAFGKYNVSNTGSTDADKTLFAVGNGDYQTRHNAFEIRQNGDIYISSGGTDIKLQDNLGGGGGGGTVDQTVISGSTNAVAGGAVYDQLGGMKIVHLTQAQYDQLQNKDNMTLYVITNS